MIYYIYVTWNMCLRQVSGFNIDILHILKRNKTSETSNMSQPTSDSFCLIATQMVCVWAKRQNKSAKSFGYPKVISRSFLWFQKEFFSGLRTIVYTNTHLIMENVSNFSSQCFGYLISHIVSDIRKCSRICYDPLTLF